MIIDRYRSELNRLGIPPSQPEVLKALPAVVVAWADGRMDRLERLRILRLAEHFGVGKEAREVLEHWLGEPPSAAVVERGLSLLRDLAAASDDDTIEPGELPDLLTHCEWIARTRSGALDAPWAVGAAEERAIHDLSLALGVDAGRTWTSIWHELDNWNDPVSAPLSLRLSSQEVR